ncbi:NnrU family protein, partial [Burkholderia sp. SIMBA_024]
MTGWGAFAAAFAVFLVSHAVPVRPPVRPWLVRRLGERGFLVAYAAVSV